MEELLLEDGLAGHPLPPQRSVGEIEHDRKILEAEMLKEISGIKEAAFTSVQVVKSLKNTIR